MMCEVIYLISAVLVWIGVNLQFVEKILIKCWVLSHLVELLYRKALIFPWILLPLKENKLWRIWIFHDTFDVHGVINLVFTLQNFLKEKVVLHSLQILKSDLSIVLSIVKQLKYHS